MATLAASAYFLTCCKPIFNSSFCFYIENPKIVNLYFYPHETLFQNQYLECNTHKKLSDHRLNFSNTCTDGRAWSLDSQQRRHHFLDIVCGRIPLCGVKSTLNSQSYDPETVEVPPKTEVDQKPKELKVKPRVRYADTKQEKVKKESSNPNLTPVKNSEEEEKTLLSKCEKTQPIQHSENEQLSLEPNRSELTPAVSSGQRHSQENVACLTNEIINKLDCNLQNLETTFDKFVKKNRDFIQNLVGCLSFEKKKQKKVGNYFNELKQEIDALKAKNEYLKMVNSKQLELFREELDKGINENRAVYNRKIHQMEVQIRTEQDEIQHYKKSERKYLEVFENENAEISKLKSDLKNAKEREKKLVKNYVNILNFLIELKETLNKSVENNEFRRKRSFNTISDSRVNADLNEVLVAAISNGVESLNVRDLSILHDAIQNLNERLCHQNDFCGKNPMTNMSISHLSMMYEYDSGSFFLEHCEERPVSDYMHRGVQDYETCSNLSIYPSKQNADQSNVQFC